MSLKNLTREQLDEDWYWGDENDKDAVEAEWKRRADESDERACYAEDERKDA